MKKFIASLIFGITTVVSATGCSPDAKVASENIMKESDNFKVLRRVVFYNGVTGEYILTVKGFCSMDINDNKTAFNVICKTDDGYKRHTMVLSDNTTAFMEQLEPSNVSSQRYEVIFKPSVIVPDTRLR